MSGMFDPPEGYFLISRDCLDNIVHAAQVAARAEVDYGACGTEADRRKMVKTQAALDKLLADFDEEDPFEDDDPSRRRLPTSGGESNFLTWLKED